VIEKTYTVTEIANKFLDWHDSLSLSQLILVWGIVFYSIDKLSSKKEKYYIPPKPEQKLGRQEFSESDKRSVRFQLRSRCEECYQFCLNLQFHHKDGNNWNNDISNCQGLCPNCHAKKHQKPKLF